MTPTATATARRLNLGTLNLRAAIVPESIDKAKRTFELTFSTGVRMLRTARNGEQFLEELEVSERAVRLDRFKPGAGGPVLLWHDRWSHRGLAGVVEDAWIAKEGTNGAGDARARCRLSTRADVDPVWQDVGEGILTRNSIAYRVHRYADVTTPDDPMPVLRAVDWELMEVSLLSVPEDAGAGMRAAGQVHERDAGESWEATIDGPTRAAGETETMKPTTTNPDPNVPATPATPAARTNEPATGGSPAAVATQPVADGTRGAGGTPPAQPAAPAVDPREDARQAERFRVTEIMRAADAAGISNAAARELVERGATVEQARAQFTNAAAVNGGAPTRSQIQITRDERDTFRGAVEDAWLSRHSPSAFKVTERGRPWMGRSMLEVARESLRIAGEPFADLSPSQLAMRALATTDLPAIMANTAGRTLRAQYAAVPQDWRGTFVRIASAKDFRPIERTQLSAAPTLLKVEEGGEVQQGAMTDGKETFSLATYARRIVVTRKTIVNDDLDAITRIPGQMGAAARRLEDALVYGVLTTNANMADGVALFHATNPAAAPHANLGDKKLTTAGALDQLRTSMRKQKGLAGEALNLTPKVLIVPAALETIARQLVSSEFVPGTQAAINTHRNMTAIVHALLDAASADVWYGAASVDQVDMVELAFLEGEEGPQIEQLERDGTLDGVAWQVHEDIVAAAIDHRGLFKSLGTV